MLTIRQALTVSKIIDRLDLKVTDPNADINAVGADLIMQVAAKAHQAQEDVCVLVSTLTGCTPEEALDKDIVEIYNESLKDQKILSFFTSAVKRKLQE